VLVLKRLADAERDGDRIYAVIKGAGSSSDGRAMSVTAPRVEGEELALRRAYAACGIDPATIGLIEAHGTGTQIGDPTELDALMRAFGPRGAGPAPCALGSIKSMIGHTMPAAGAAGLIKTALALYHRTLPPTLNCRLPAEALTREDSRFYVNTETRPWVHGRRDAPRRAGVNAFGFGGVNCHVVLEEYVAPRAEDAGPFSVDAAPRELVARKWVSELLVLEGDTREALRDEARRLSEYARQAEGVALVDLAATVNAKLTDKPFRLAVVATSPADLATKLDRADRRLGDPDCTQIKDAKGIFYFSESPLRGGKVAFLFPGEGAQYVNMLADLYPLFPEIQACFDAADRAVTSTDRYPPSADIFPPPSFDEASRAEAEARLFKIERATEAVLTADAAMLMLLQRMAVGPDVMTGHSAGEWIALVAAGMLEVDEFVGSMDRLDAMYRQLETDTTIPKMSMLAVGTSRDKVLALADEIDCTVHVANDNCPHQVVIVVDPKDTDAVVTHLRRAQVFVEVLPFDRGYHTPVFTYICGPLRSFFSSLSWRAGTTTLYSCTTGRPYPADHSEMLDVVSGTFARPLIFRETVEAMYGAGARIFVEVGPRANLSGFVSDILRGKEHIAIPTNQHRRPGVTTLHQALGMLSALHVPVDLSVLYERRSPATLSLDPELDRAIDERQEPGTISVPLAYPRLKTDLTPIKRDVDTMNTQPQSGRRAPEADAAEVRATPEPPPRAQEPTRQEPTTQASLPQEPAPQDVRAQAGPPSPAPVRQAPSDAPSSDATSAMLTQHMRLMEEFLETQQQIMRAYLGTGGAPRSEPADRMPPVAAPPSAPVPTAPATPAASGPTPAPPVADAPATSQVPWVAEPEPTPAIETTIAEPVPPDGTGGPVGAPVTASPATPAAVSLQAVQEVLIDIVSDKTGYPAEMLDLDLDMEAELGIDSIKRVEILGALQQRADELSLGGDIDLEEVSKLKTLRAVVEFLVPEGVVAAGSASTSTVPTATPEAESLPFAGSVTTYEPGVRLVVTRNVDLDEDLYLADHCFDPPSSAWDTDRDRLHVVPLTCSVEMMAEVASLLAPGRVVIRAERIQAGKWIDVHREVGPVPVTIEAVVVPATSDVSVAIRRDDGAGGEQIVAEATFACADDFPQAPALEPFPLKGERSAARTARAMYEERRMFHGPRFQGVASLDTVGEDGLSAQLEVLPVNDLFASNSAPTFLFDPFLLDAAGQLVGYWPVEYLDEGFVLFPIKVKSITRYRANPEPGALTRCQLRVRHVGQRQLRADMDIVAPDGTLWLRVEGWEDWRFYWDRTMYDFWRAPLTGTISTAIAVPLPPGHDDVECRRLAPFGEMAINVWARLWGLLLLGSEELAAFDAMEDGPRRLEWLYGRAVAKEAVRAWVKRHHGLDLYPADVWILTDKDGRPCVDGPWLAQIGERPQVSIAHKGSEAVAAAGRAALGIDLEIVTSRDAGFDQAAFDTAEREILDRLNGGSRDEWVTRAWCAKEAAGKALGIGLAHGPGTMTLQSVDPAVGHMIVGCGKREESGGAGDAARAFVVHYVRDGDFVVALAVQERNAYDDARS